MSPPGSQSNAEVVSGFIVELFASLHANRISIVIFGQKPFVKSRMQWVIILSCNSYIIY